MFETEFHVFPLLNNVPLSSIRAVTTTMADLSEIILVTLMARLGPVLAAKLGEYADFLFSGYLDVSVSPGFCS